MATTPKKTRRVSIKSKVIKSTNVERKATTRSKVKIAPAKKIDKSQGLVASASEILEKSSLKGFIESYTDSQLYGWVYDSIQPDQALVIKVYCGDCLVGEGRADIMRGDLKDAGLGNGQHGFVIKLDEKLMNDGAANQISLISEHGKAIPSNDFHVEVTTKQLSKIKNKGYRPLYFENQVIVVENMSNAKEYLTPYISLTANKNSFYGFIDEVTDEDITGWVVRGDGSSTPIVVEMLCDDHVIGYTQTNYSRPDIGLLLERKNIYAGFKISADEFDFSDVDIGGQKLSLRVKNTQVYFNLDDFSEKQKAFLQHNLLQEEIANIDASEKIFHASNNENNNSHLELDGILGRNIVGWAIHDNKGEQRINISLAGHVVSSFIANKTRSDLDSEYGFAGFYEDIGGIFQFLALSKRSPKLNLALELDPLNAEDKAFTANIYIPEAITFTPMSLVLDERVDQCPFYCNKASIIVNNVLELSFKKRQQVSSQTYRIDVYQMNSDEMKLIMSRIIEANADLARVSGELVDIKQPVLVVITELSNNEFVFIDCIPYPALLHSDHELMIELHSFFVNGQQPLLVIRRLQKHWLDYQSRILHPESFAAGIKQGNGIPGRRTTSVIFYSRTPDALTNSNLLPDWMHLAEKAFFLKWSNGQYYLEEVRSLNGEGLDENDEEPVVINDFSEISSSHFLFWDILAVVRPDYWSVVSAYCTNSDRYKAISGNSIVYDGQFVPNYVGHKPLTGFSEKEFNFLPLSTALFQRDALIQLSSEIKNTLQLLPENIVSRFNESSIFHIRIPVDLRREEPILRSEKLFLSTFVGISSQTSRMGLAKESIVGMTQPGFSIVINFRNAANLTNKAITALKMQQYSGNIELILVNNGSHPSEQHIIISHAISLFGEESVKVIDYLETFNHSKQTNLAVEQATQPLLLMLSNDAFLLSANCLQQAADILQNPQVASCGFRIIRPTTNGFRVESVGLQFALGSLCTLGGQILRRNIPLERHSNKVMRVAGNTFAAAAIRTDFFKQIGGMNVDKFPTTYNDVEFCVRAAGERLYHVVAGNCVVQHSGRGTREPDLDFPTEPAILYSVSNINDLADSYALYGFGDIRVF